MEKTRNEKLQFLHKAMIRYENITGQNLEVMKQALYYRRGVKSRADLTDEDLDAEIEYFTAV